MNDFTSDQLLSIRLDMYKFSRRIGLDEVIAQIVAQNASDSARGIGQHKGCENDRENAKHIFSEISQFCVEVLGYTETWSKLIAEQAAFCGDVCTIRWYLPSLHCNLPRGHSIEQHGDSRDTKKRRWSWNPLYKRVDI